MPAFRSGLVQESLARDLGGFASALADPCLLFATSEYADQLWGGKLDEEYGSARDATWAECLTDSAPKLGPTMGKSPPHPTLDRIARIFFCFVKCRKRAATACVSRTAAVLRTQSTSSSANSKYCRRGVSCYDKLRLTASRSSSLLRQARSFMLIVPSALLT